MPLSEATTPEAPKNTDTQVNAPPSPTLENKERIPAFKPESLNSTKEFNDELMRLKKAFDKDASLSPYEGDIHKKRQALARDVVKAIMDNSVSDSRKLELFDLAIDHIVFAHRTIVAPFIHGLSATVRYFKPAEHTTPVMPSKSQNPLITARDELYTRMEAEKAKP